MNFESEMSAISGKTTDTENAATKTQTNEEAFKFGRTTLQPTRYWLIFWSILGVSCLPFLIPYGITLTRQELYQYFPFVIAGVGYLFFLRWDRVVAGPRDRVSWFFIWAGFFFFVAGTLIHSTWLGNLAFLSFTYSFLRSHMGQEGDSLGYLTLPMLMLVRIPQLHANSLVSRLQKVTTQLSDLSLDLLSVPHDSFANRLRLPGKELFVAEACSGIQSAFTMCFIALLLLVWKKRPVLLTPIYITFALVFAVLANTLRVTSIAIADVWFGWDWTSGWGHDSVGYISLAVAAGILWSFDKLCEISFHPVEIDVDARGANPFSLVWNWLLGSSSVDYEDVGYTWNTNDSSAETKEDESPGDRRNGMPLKSLMIAGMTALCGLIMLTGIALGRSDFRPITSKSALLFDPPSNLLGNRIGVLSIGNHEIVRNGSDPQLGLHADVWKCSSSDAVGQLVMSQPYVGWHELCVCYEVQEWKLDRRYNLAVPEGKPVAVGEFSKGEDMKGYLIFTAIDTDGNVPMPPSYTLFGRLIAPFIPLITDDYAETSGSAQTVMLQMWTVSERAMDSAELIELAQSIAAARETARASLLKYQSTLAGSK